MGDFSLPLLVHFSLPVTPITPQELEEVFQLEDQQAFYRAMEKLLGAVIYPDDDRLGKEFHCVTNDMWMGLYEEKSEGDS